MAKHAKKAKFLYLFQSANIDAKPGCDNAGAATPYRLQPRSNQINCVTLSQASHRVVIVN